MCLLLTRVQRSMEKHCCAVYRLCTVHCRSMLLLLLLSSSPSSTSSSSSLLFYFMSLSFFFGGGGGDEQLTTCHLALAIEDVVIFHWPLKMLSSSTDNKRRSIGKLQKHVKNISSEAT